MMYLLIVAALLVCAIQAVRSARLLSSALWLAGASALTALLMYLLGAPEVAVIELSVGAGLVTVLFVFAINIAGEEEGLSGSPLPAPLTIVLILIVVVLIGWLVLPALNIELPMLVPMSLSSIIWGSRAIDVLLQIVLIFAGTLGMLGMLGESKPAKPHHKEAQK